MQTAMTPSPHFHPPFAVTPHRHCDELARMPLSQLLYHALVESTYKQKPRD